MEAAARAVVCLHATDPASVYLSAWARTAGMTREQLDTALYDTRTLVKQLAMRRTLFVFDRELLPAAVGGPAVRVAESERRKTARDVERAGGSRSGAAWLAAAESEVVEVLEAHGELSASSLTDLVPAAALVIRAGGNGKWAQDIPVASRLLTILSAAGRVVRAHNRGSWATSRPTWATMERWLGAPLTHVERHEALTTISGAWLRAFGPGTVADLKWWLGSTLTEARSVLATLEAVEVGLDGGDVGYVLPDDLDEVQEPEPWGALLPALDPTTMGWAGRDWYLGEYRSHLFDTNGNAGPTAWWNGRAVGGWHQEPSGEVVLHLLEPLSRQARRALEQKAAELSAWLEGQRVLPRFPTPLYRNAVSSAP